MHEYSIVRALLDRVEVEARRHGATAVHRIHLSIGTVSGVETELLASAFELVRPRTVCSAAELEIRRVEPRWECSACGGAIPPGGPLRCPDCARPARLVAGDEIFLERLEMEVA